MTIALDTPEQISMWVLLSRRHQIQLHMKGLTVRGLAASLKRDFPGQGRNVKDFVVPVEFAISQAGGEVDYKLVNVHAMEVLPNGNFKDMGIWESMDAAGEQAGIKALFFAGRMELVLTTDAVREPNGKQFMPA